MIVDNIRGGLGNQMYQYAFGRAIQQETGQVLLLDIYDYKFDHYGRSFALSFFVLGNNVRIDSSGSFCKSYSGNGSIIRKFAGKLFPKATFSYLKKKSIFYWDQGSYLPINSFPPSSDIFLFGYWQSPLYFDGIKNLLKNDFQPKHPLSTENEKLVCQIRNVNSVGVHVRRTDSLSNKSPYTPLSYSYYYKAMDLAEKELNNPVFFVFSDDIEDVKKHFVAKNHRYIFVDHNNSGENDFCLLRSCKNLILANSSFSWWAGYLIENEKAMIIAPVDWYKDGHDLTSFFPLGWVFLSN